MAKRKLKDEPQADVIESLKTSQGRAVDTLCEVKVMKKKMDHLSEAQSHVDLSEYEALEDEILKIEAQENEDLSDYCARGILKTEFQHIMEDDYAIPEGDTITEIYDFQHFLRDHFIPLDEKAYQKDLQVQMPDWSAAQIKKEVSAKKKEFKQQWIERIQIISLLVVEKLKESVPMLKQELLILEKKKDTITNYQTQLEQIKDKYTHEETRIEYI